MKTFKNPGSGKMRKLYALIFAILLTISCALNVSASESMTTKQNIIFHDDGSYSVIIIEVQEARTSSSKVGTKTYLHYSANNVLQWSAVLRGMFHFDGTSATCTSSVCDVTIHNTEWNVVSKNVRTSGNSALADLKMNRVYSGIVTETKTVNLSLSCDANGNLS